MDLPPRKPSCLTEHFCVDRKAKIAMLFATSGRLLHCSDDGLIANMPISGPDIVQISFFEAGSSLHDDEVARQCNIRSLRICDPLSLLVCAKTFPDFADRQPHVTLWQTEDGSFVYMSMYSLQGRRRVMVKKVEKPSIWSETTNFAGISIKS